MAELSELQVAKQSLRDRMGAHRPDLAPAVREVAGRALAAALLADAAVAGAAQVALFAAAGGEPPTRPLFDALAERSISRLLPRVEGDSLVFVPVARWQDLMPGRFGILAPPSGPAATLGREDVVIVPGVAFDAHGGRLGRGGGFYDRAFPSHAEGPRLVGAAYARQLVEFVPCDSRDRVMDAIVTEDGLRWISRER